MIGILLVGQNQSILGFPSQLFVVKRNKSMPYSTYCKALDVDLKGLTTVDIFKLVEQHVCEEQSRHICVHKLKPPEDQSTLSRCGRCKMVYYSSPEAQKVHNSLLILPLSPGSLFILSSLPLLCNHY